MTAFTDELPTFRGTDRFVVQSVLGRGASGVVYRVQDREMDRDVALKTLVSVDPDWRFRLKTEFRRLASISHPNLVELYELVSDERHCFFTMELLGGGTFSTVFPSGRPAAPDDLPRLGEVTAQLVEAISALHDAGKLHRDIKPSNVIVTDTERAVLVDFGLCDELRILRRGPTQLAGTLLYMAPEQAWGRPLSPSADWYSLGAMIFEALVGSAAFSESGAALLMAKQRLPTVPANVSGSVRDAALACTRLMHPDPGARAVPAELLETLAAPSSRAVRSVPRERSPALLVGRDDELSVLNAAFVEARSGRPAVALLTGPSGIGKTALLTSFLSTYEAGAPSVILRGRCHPQETVSYDGLDGAVDELSEWLLSLPAAEREALLPEDLDALLDLFPILGRVVPAPREVDKSSEPLARRRKGVAVLRALLRRLCDRQPVIISMDDAHWGGADTGALLAELLREGCPNFLLILAFREEDSATSPLLTVLRERLPELLETVHRASLRPLDENASTELARRLIDRDRENADALATSVSLAARGHPLFLRELALAATESSGTGAETRSLDLRTLLRDRVSALPAEERRLLDLASIAGRPISRQTLLSAGGHGEPGRLLLQKLAKQRLLRETTHGAEDAPTFETYHAQIRDAVMSSMDGEARRALHRALADALLSADALHAELLVDHLEGAGDRTKAAEYACVAADQAARKLAFDRAAHFYQTALDLGAGPSFRLYADLAAALANAGKSVAAAHAYGAAADAARSNGLPEAVDLARLAAEHDLRGGNFERGITRLKHVLRSADVPYPSSALSAFGTVVLYRSWMAWRGLDFAVRPAAERDTSKLARLDACWTAGLGLAWIDRTRTAAFQARYMALALESGDPGRIVRWLATEASQLACLGGSKRTTKARALIEKALGMLEPHDRLGRSFVVCLAGSIEFYASNWREALTHCRLGERVLEEAGVRSEWEAMTSQTLAFASLAYLGELRELESKQRELLADARDRGNRLTEACLSSGPANISWLAADAPAEAERRADHALAPWKNDDFQLAHYLHLVAKAQIDLYRGRPDDTLARLDREWKNVILSMTLHVQNFRVTLRHLRARAALASATAERGGSHRQRMLRVARNEARRLASEDVAWAHPLARSIEAGILSVSGKRAEATECLDRAILDFERLEMKLYVDAARYGRGQLTGGSSGRTLVADAERSMLAKNVVRPDLIAATLVPILA